MPQDNRLRVSAILAHISFDEAFVRRNEIPINLMGSDVISHSRWVYLVEWELTNGELMQTWEPGDRLYCEELDEYNEKHGLKEDRNTSWALVHFYRVKEEENDEARAKAGKDKTNTNTVTNTVQTNKLICSKEVDLLRKIFGEKEDN